MSHIDKITHFALRTVDAMARDDHQAYLDLDREIKAAGYDGFHVAQTLASMVLHAWQRDPDWRAKLDHMLEQARLFDELGLPDDKDEGMFQ